MQSIKTHSRNSGIASPIHLCPRWKCTGGQHHSPDALPTGRHPRYPVNRMLDRPHSRYNIIVAEICLLKIE